MTSPALTHIARLLRPCLFACLPLVTGLTGPALHASNVGKTWRVTTPLPTSGDLTGVVWTGTQLVAVGHGAALTSTDGTSWTTSDAGGEYCTSLAWSGSMLVAGVSDNGVVLTSQDGLSWTRNTIAYSGSIQQVIWSGGQFVALGQTNTNSGPTCQLLTSPDGLAWSTFQIAGFSSIGTNLTLNAVTWTGSLYVVAGYLQDVVSNSITSFLASSPDGVTWTQQATLDANAPDIFYALAWTGTQVVAAGDGGAIYTSPTGADPWTGQDSGTSTPLSTVIWDGTQIVAAGVDTVVTSDGVNWTASTPTSLSPTSLTYTGTQYVAVGPAGGTYTSPDATTWTQQTPSGPTSSRLAVVWTGTQYVSVGADNAADIQTSPDGVTWTEQSPPDPTSILRGITLKGTTLVAVGDSGTFITSPNGIDWTAATTTPDSSFSLSAVAATSSLAVAVGGSGGFGGTGGIFTSTNLDTWTAVTVPPGTSNLYGITYTGTQWVAVGNQWVATGGTSASSGVILTSTNGTTWTQHTPSSVSGGFYGVAASPSIIVAVGESGFCTSTNGTTWKSNNTLNFYVPGAASVIWTGTDFIATSYGQVLTSTDGLHWGAYATGTNQTLNGLAWNGTQALAAGAAGIVLVSDTQPSVTTGAASITAQENDGTVQVLVNLSFAPTSTVTVPFTVSGTAVLGAGKDCTVSTSPLTFTQGTTSQAITVTINPNSTSTSNPTVVLTLGTPSGGMHLGNPSSTVLTIQDHNGPPPINFSSPALTANESDGTVGVEVHLGWPATSTVTVPFIVAGTATAGVDFTAPPATLTFNAGDQFKSVLIPIIDHGLVSGSNTVALTLGTPTNATLGSTTTFTLTILDNDIAPGGPVGTQWTHRNPQPTDDGLNCVAWSPTVHRLVALGNNGSALTSDDGGITWTHRLTGSSLNSRSLAWGGQQFVGVGDQNAVLTSPDGIGWAQHPLPVGINQNDAGLQKVVWANNLFIAMGHYDDPFSGNYTPMAFISRDGIHWSQCNLGSSPGAAESAVWTGTQYVMVGENFPSNTTTTGLVLTSPDGFIWTNRSSKANIGGELTDVKWTGTQLVALAGDKQVAIAGGGTQLIPDTAAYTSLDGITWTKRTVGTLGWVQSQVWTGSKFVAVGKATATSANGTTWTEKPSGLTLSLSDVTYTGPMFPPTQFVAVGGTSTIMTSPDGVTWTRRSAGVDVGSYRAARSVAWSGTQFAAVGDNGLIMASPDGSAWTQRVSPPTGDLSRIVWSGTMFVAVGWNGAILTSPDGVTWSVRASGTTLHLGGVIWSGSQFVVVGGTDRGYDENSNPTPGSSIVLTSPNGITWTKHVLPPAVSAVSLNGIAYNGTQYLAVGDSTFDYTSFTSTPTVLTSPDAINWTSQTGIPSSYNFLNDVTWSGSQFIVVGNNGTIMSSADGATWLAASTIPSGANFWSVISFGSTLVVAGDNGTILTSPDGDIWTAQASRTNKGLYGLAWNGAVLVSVGENGLVLTSGTGSPPVPTLTFTTSSATANVGDAPLILGLDLTSPATQKISIPLSFTGTNPNPVRVGAAGDVILPVSPAVFNPGQTHLDLILKINPSNKVGPTRLGTLTLTKPASGANLGTSITFGLTLNNPNQAVQFTTSPQSGWFTVGDALSLSVAATGSGSLTYQWQKTGANIPAATSTTFQIDSLKVTDGGAYAAVATNNVGPVPSSIAEVAVVDTSPHVVVVGKGTTATLIANAQGKTGALSYQWFANGSPVANSGTRITGAATKTLVIKLADPIADAGNYTCTITSSAQSDSKTTGVYAVYVTTGKPQFDPGNPVPDPLPDGGVATLYTPFSVPVVTDSTLTPAKFTASGLPAGLFIDPVSGIIYGTPTAAVTNKAVTITATNASGSASAVTHITVAPLTPGIAGTFDGFLQRDSMFDALQGSRFQATITSTGSYTGKIIVGTTNYAFSGTLTNDGANFVSTTPLVRAKLPATSLTLTCDPTQPNYLTIALEGPGAAAPSPGIAGSAWLNTWNATSNPASLFQGYYTFNIDLDSAGAQAGDLTVPQGTGYGSFTVPAGSTTFAISGKLADGSTFTTTTFLGPNGEVLLYQPLYAGKGGLLGFVTVTTGTDTPNIDGTVSALGLDAGTLDWLAPASTPAIGRNYPAGYEVAPVVTGARYIAPTGGTVVMGITNTTSTNAALAFHEQDLSDNADTPDIDVQLIPAGTIKTFSGNTNKVSLTVTPATGAFTGSFTLPAVPDPADSTITVPARVVTFNGFIVTDSTGSGSGKGWFLLPTLPDPAALPPLLPAQTPIRSGLVQLSPL